MHALSDGHSLFVLHSGKTTFSANGIKATYKRCFLYRKIDEKCDRREYGTFVTSYKRITHISTGTLAYATMVLDVTLGIRGARIDVARIDAPAVQACHVRCALRVTLTYRSDLFVHWKCAK